MVNKVIIYGKDECALCVKSKWLFKTFMEKYKYEMVYIELNEENKKYLTDLIGVFKTVPQILINGEHIGGYKEFMEWIEHNIWT